MTGPVDGWKREREDSLGIVLPDTAVRDALEAKPKL
jgi:hypothetical protein